MSDLSVNSVGAKLSAFFLLCFLTSCLGGKQLEPVPAPQALGLSCAGAYVIGSHLERPAEVQVWNETNTAFRIALDQCDTQKHLGWVRPGAVVVFALPQHLVQFPDGLRFYAYPLESQGKRRTLSVKPGSLTLRLVITSAG